MAVTANKMAPNGGATDKTIVTSLVPVVSQTALTVRILQLAYSFLVTGVSVFASAITDTLTGLVGIVTPGGSVEGVTMVIGTTTSKFKISAAFTGVMPVRVLNEALQRVFRQAITDNIPFSTAFTVNVAGAAVVTWGAVRVQRDYAGNISTLVVAQDQAFGTEAEALYAVPAAGETMFDLGTITIEMASGHTFTGQTTALTGGNVTAVNYNGAVAALRDVCDTDPQLVAATFVRADLKDVDSDRGVATAGGLLVVQYTTDGNGAGTNAEITVDLRPWPLNGEVATRV